MMRTLQDIQNENINLISILDCDKRYVYVVDAENFEILFANKAVQTLWGKTEPYLGKVCYKFIKGEEQPCANCTVPFLKPGEQACYRPCHYDTNLGVWLNITVCRTLWEQRAAYYINIENITEVELNRQQVERDNAIISSISRQVYEFVSIIDTKDRTISFREINDGVINPAPTRTSNYDEDSLYAIEQMVIPEEQEKCRRRCKLENIMSKLELKNTYSYSWTQPYEDGSTARKQLTFWWLDKPNHKMLCLKNDVSDVYAQEQQQIEELRRSKEAADNANATKTRFLANMSHDIRTPLHSILGIAALAKDQYDKPQVMEKYWSTVTVAGDYLLALINDILDMAKIEENSLKLTIEPYSNEDFHKYITSLFGLECKAKNINLVYGAMEKPVTVMTDILRFNQIFFNLFSNAVKFTPSGGTIYFTANIIDMDDNDVDLEIEVRDTGIGMSEEFQKRMFNPFEQADEDNRKGTGLGLSITKRLVELFHGTIQVQSKLGEGTSIKIRFKMQRGDKLVDHEDTGKEEVVLTGRQILLAEDHPLNQLITKKLLEREGIKVICAGDGQEALDIFQSSAPHSIELILMDMRMPKLSGAEATKAIRALSREDAASVPVIALTANAYAEDIQEAVDAGMNDHLSKPIVMDKFFTAIKRWLQRKNS